MFRPSFYCQRFIVDDFKMSLSHSFASVKKLNCGRRSEAANFNDETVSANYSEMRNGFPENDLNLATSTLVKIFYSHL